MKEEDPPDREEEDANLATAMSEMCVSGSNAATSERSRITSTPASASRTGGAQSAEVTVIYNPQTHGAPHLPAVTVVDMSDVRAAN